MSATQRIEELVGAAGLGTLPALPGIPVLAPASTEEAAELLRCASSEGLRVALCGGGSKLGWALQAETPEVAISTRRLDAVVEFEPGDGVLTAGAGARLSTLMELAAAEGLELTPDVPRPDRATLGGVLGAGQSGPDRLGHGPLRNQLLGTRSIQLPGTVTRSGGRLVKNVSGYDAHRLLTGSHGSLALVIEASLRLATAPEERVVITSAHAELASALEAAGRLRASGIGPRTLTVENSLGSAWRLHAVLAGRAGHVARVRECASAILGGELECLEGAAARERCVALRDLEPDGSSRPALRLTAAPTRLAATLEALQAQLGPREEQRLLIQPGVATIDLEPGQAAELELAACLAPLRRALRPLGATAQLRLAAPGRSADLADTEVDPTRLALQQRLRSTYDPGSLLTLRPPLGGLR